MAVESTALDPDEQELAANAQIEHVPGAVRIYESWEKLYGARFV
jgi:hypothetical protein